MARKNRNILFTSFLSERQLDDYYSLADVFVTASKSETQGMVLLESAAHGLPMVAYNSPVTVSFIKENRVGLVTNGKDFSTKVRRILYNKDLRKKLKRNCQTATRKYDIRKCTNDLLDVYKSLL